MRIGIIGGGAIGLLFASYLSKFFDVTIYTKTQQQARDLNESGLVLLKQNHTEVIPVKAGQISEWNAREELTVVAVKQYQLEAVITELRKAPILDSLLFLQNGMGHLKFIENLPARNLYIGSVEHGALKENSTTVHHTGVGVANVAVFKGDKTQLEKLLSVRIEDFKFALKPDYYEMLVNKLVVNAVINPLTAVLEVKNGALLTNPYFSKISGQVFNEIAAILQLKNPEEHLRRVMRVCGQTAENRSSMLKDIESGRKTEIDAIIGFLLEEAGKMQRDTTILSLIYQFIKGKEIDARSNR